MAASLPVICINDESFKETVIDNLNGKIFEDKEGYQKAVIELYKIKNYAHNYQNKPKIQL